MDKELNTELFKLFNQFNEECFIEQLRASLQTLFKTYILSFEGQEMPKDFNTVVNNYYYLFDFIEKLEQINPSNP